VIERSAVSATCVLTVTLLLALVGSLVVDETVSVSVMLVPAATFVFTFTTKVKFAVVFATIAEPSVHLKGAVVVQVQPAGPVRETKVVFAGSVSVMTGAAALAGPEFVTVCV